MDVNRVKHTEIKKIKGVRVACIGEQSTGIDDLTTYDVPPDHDVFDIGEECPVSKLIGMPLLVSKVRPTLKYAATRDSFKYSLTSAHYPNKTVKILMICCDPALVYGEDVGTGLLKAPRRWIENVGSVIIVRKDCQPLYVHHVKILLRFLQVAIGAEPQSPWLRANLPTLIDHPRYDRSDSATRVRIPRRSARNSQSHAEDVITRFTPKEFKDYYMGEKFYWKYDKDLATLLKLPSPFTTVSKPVFPPKRKLAQAEYWKRSYAERRQNAKTWEEQRLLTSVEGLSGDLKRAETRTARIWMLTVRWIRLSRF